MAFCPGRESIRTNFATGSGPANNAATRLFFLYALLLVAVVAPCALASPDSDADELAREFGEVARESASAQAALTDTLVVSARALTDAITPSAAGLVTVIELGESSRGKDLTEILGRTAGFQIRRYGGLGFAAVPSLRGSSAAQIRIYVDGLPLNDAQTGSTDLSRLPTERFARAEIHRGLVPAGLGGAGGAGAINLVTQGADDGIATDLYGGGLGHLGGRLSWGVSTPDGAHSALIMLHGRKAENKYEFYDNYQTYNEAQDDTVRTRQNAWFEEWGIWGRGHTELGLTRWRLSGGWFRKDGGRPGPIPYPSNNATVATDRLDGSLRGELPAALTCEVGTARSEQVLYDPENEADRIGFNIRSVGYNTVYRLSWSPSLSFPQNEGIFLTNLSLTTGAENRLETYHQWYGDAEDPSRNRRTSSLFAAPTLEWDHGRLQITPAWRYQFMKDDFPPLPALPHLPEEVGVVHRRHDISPSIGALYALVPGELTLEAHFGESVRVPNWVELFGHRGGIDGNRDLAPEEIRSKDLAVLWEPTREFSARLTAFALETEETIIFIQNSPATAKAQNVGATENWGLELECRIDFSDNLVLTGNFTRQHPVDRGIQAYYEGNRLPYLSMNEMDLRLAGHFGAWRPWLELSGRGHFYRDRDNTELIEAQARSIWNMGLSHDIAQGMTLSAEVMNLNNDRTYDIMQFPVPGRTWQVGLRRNFGERSKS